LKNQFWEEGSIDFSKRKKKFGEKNEIVDRSRSVVVVAAGDD
jgi:hypothetical protein